MDKKIIDTKEELMENENELNSISTLIYDLEKYDKVNKYKTLVARAKLLEAKRNELYKLLDESCNHPLWYFLSLLDGGAKIKCKCVKCGIVREGDLSYFDYNIIKNNVKYDEISSEYEMLEEEKKYDNVSMKMLIKYMGNM